MFLFLASFSALADIPPSEPAGASTAPAEATDAEPEFHPILGPAHVDLGNDLAIDLPEGFLLLERAEAQKLSEENGNSHDPSLVAMIARDDADWVVHVEYVADGYVSDDDAADLDADDLLQSYKDGTEEENAERKKRGFSALHVDGWTEAPQYDGAAHRLTWGLAGHDDDGEKSVNFFTRVLGRRGYASLDLIAAPEELEGAKGQTKLLLAATAFGTGARYEDFDANTDKVAEYGIAALVLGGAGAVAAKTGLLAKLFALLLAGKKFIVVGVAALIGGIKRLFGGGTKEPER